MEKGLEEHSYSGKLRVRVCGICLQNNQLLLIRHKPFAQNKHGFWSPPGGGVHFGESLKAGLMREFKEETGLHVEVGKFLFVHEFIATPLHALEMFFEVFIKSGTLETGFDPEFTPDNQLITEAVFKSLSEIQKLPAHQLHQTLQNIQSFDNLFHNSFSSSIR